MPPRHEHQPRPKPPEKKAPPTPTERPELEKAKKTIEKATSRDYKIRAEIVEELRSKPFVEGSLEDTKKAIGSLDKISWLLKSTDDIQYSAEVAKFAADIASAGDLADDPRWLLSKTIELAYSARADATEDVRREINKYVAEAGKKIKVQLQNAPSEGYQGIKTTSFDEAVHGGPIIKGMLDKDKSVFDEDNPEDETITDPELIRLLRSITSKLQTDRGYFSDPDNLREDIRKIQGLERSGVPRNQIKEAIDRIRNIQNSVPDVRARREEMANRAVSYEEMRGKLLPEDQVDHGFQEVFPFHHITPAEVQMLKQGEAGQQQFFYEFITGIYSMGRTPERAELPDMSKWDEFSRFMKWLYPERTDYHMAKYEYMWKETPKHHQIIKNLLFTPGDIRDKLKNLQFMTPADMDHYIKNIAHANYALSLYEDAVFDVLSERQVQFKEALEYLRGGNSAALNRYRELAKARKHGRLDLDDERRFQELQEKVDIVGYGVNLWDADIQNYMELDLEINEMSKELDRLALKQQSGQPLEEWETERQDRLKEQIKYKQERHEEARVREYGVGLKEAQHNNKGLSQIDLEVKERLRVLLQGRLGRDPQEWELNQAVWAARQWMIGSSRLVSISSAMAIRPASEFLAIGEVNIGKYVMRAPAFEDLQRVINPELFQVRFGVGSKMGDVYRAILDRGLLERKNFKFQNDPKYRRTEEAHLDPLVRQTREFMRQVEAQTGIPYSEMLTQGFFQSGGDFDKTGWRGEIATVDEIRKKYMRMQQEGKITGDQRLDNQALGIQLTMKNDPVGRKEILERMVRRTPSKLLHLLGEPMNAVFARHGLNEADRKVFQRALSISKVDTWDVEGQRGDNRQRAFQDIDFLDPAKGDFDAILRPYLQKEGVPDAKISAMRSVLTEAGEVFKAHADRLAAKETDLPITLTITDIDWKEASMFQIGNIAMDRRARDMGEMAAARNAWMDMHKPEFLANRDPKETLKKLKEFRDAMGNYTTPDAAEKATYELARSWLKFNMNRSVIYENREGGMKGRILGVARVLPSWIPGWVPAKKVFAEMDTRQSPLAKILLSKTGKGEDAHYRFGSTGEKLGHWIHEMPHKVADSISYASRFTGAHGNAFDEKQIDEIIDQMLSMGLFNTEGHLYHDLRNEFQATMGGQVYGMVRKYWWLLPLLAAAFGAKEGVEEEKKH